MAQICDVKLQCKNRCLLVSSASPHNEDHDTTTFSFLFNTSCVRQVLLATNHVKHLGPMYYVSSYLSPCKAKVLCTFLHKLCLLLLCWGLPILLLTEKAPSLLCLHLKELGTLVLSENFCNIANNLATLSTSQPFKNLLKNRFHPCDAQHSLIFASGLLHSKTKSGKDSFRGICLFQD